MADPLRAACVQMTSGIDITENLEKAAGLIKSAAEQGAGLVITPENTCHIRNPAQAKLDSSLPMDQHIGIPFFSALAKELGIILLIGSMAVKKGDKLVNRSFLFGSDGALKTTYDKIHLFDVALANSETYRESDVFKAGSIAAAAQISDDFTLGLSICYDIRFPHLYRDLAKSGANIICVPAAFTVPTGKAHWETLLRARAIETGSYVLASAQVGEHENGRKTYGHSMIINPWGEVVECKAEGQGFIITDLDVEAIKKARSAIPALTHDKHYNVEKVSI